MLASNTVFSDVDGLRVSCKSILLENFRLFFFFKHDGHGIFSHILTVSAQTLRNAIIISYYPEATGILGLKGSKEDFSRFLKRKETKAV